MDISNQKLDNILPGIYFWIVMGNKITTDHRYVVHPRESRFVSKEPDVLAVRHHYTTYHTDGYEGLVFRKNTMPGEGSEPSISACPRFETWRGLSGAWEASKA